MVPREQVMKLYQVIGFTHETSFKHFSEPVSDARHTEVADPNKAIITEVVTGMSFKKGATDENGF